MAGLVSACGGQASVSQTVETHTEAEALTYNNTAFGSSVYSVSSFSYGGDIYYQPNYFLGGGLDPYSGLGPNGPSVYGSSLGGVAADGSVVAGNDVEGTEFLASTTEGGSVLIRIDDVEQGEDHSRDTLLYEVSVGDGTSRQPLCGLDAEGDPIRAFVLPGAWDYQKGPGRGGAIDSDHSFFFACQGSSVAKCYEMGFKPWVFGGHGNKVIDLHTACVRALRADYCGDGESHTVAGVTLGVYSEPGGAPDASHHFEAVWDGRGAQCLREDRLQRDESELPACVRKKVKKNCEESKSAQAVVFTSYASSVLASSNAATYAQPTIQKQEKQIRE